MDKKEIQLGGGHKHSKNYYHPHTLKKSKFYRIRSGNLELVTVIECISAGGTSMPPSSILSHGAKSVLLDLREPIGGSSTPPTMGSRTTGSRRCSYHMRITRK
ncbi:hypothetical protein BJV78DRAFT_1324755 [Lactifluus subvellereus]|nr:hypothetical protein BJV78DRAFT_1324755 [Lactifluus subvellereus]